MQINTEFSVGDSVYFVQDSMIYRRVIRQILIEVNRNLCAPERPIQPLISYYFDQTPSRGGMDIYKYEGEVAATKEALVQKLSVDEPKTK